ncbi:MAG: signal recognition particle-docking protein FtsY [Acidimicrobiales bacterium]
MELAVVVLIAVLVLGVLAAGVVVTRHRRKVMEPPPLGRPVGLTRPATPARPATATRPVTPIPPTPDTTEAQPEPPQQALDDQAEVQVDAEVQVEADVVEVGAVDVGAVDVGAVEDVEEPAPVVARPSFRDRLTKAREAIAGSFRSILSRTTIDADTWDELEEALIKADVGVELTTEVLDELRRRAKDAAVTEPEQLLDLLKAQLKERMAGVDRSLHTRDGVTNVWLFVGVNGVGKTTTIGKVGHLQTKAGRPVLMAAGDTFRAAAAEQLETWAERAGAEFVRGAEGGDPSSVVYDGVQRAHARGIDLVLADTAGRLHTKSNLMEELAKVRRVAGKDPGHVSEVLLVLDAVTGQNGLVQARQFTEATELTGVVLTKLDGSAKGGIVLAIETKLNIPVKLVGLGETIEDLTPFDPDEFVDALFG